MARGRFGRRRKLIGITRLEAEAVVGKLYRHVADPKGEIRVRAAIANDDGFAGKIRRICLPIGPERFSVADPLLFVASQ